MLDLDLELVIGGYLMLEYSLSFNLFLCAVTQTRIYFIKIYTHGNVFAFLFLITYAQE